MSADLLYFLILVTLSFGGLGYAIYRSDGATGVKYYCYGIVSVTAFFVVAVGGHIGIHCAMETCQDSMFYTLLSLFNG